MRRNPSSQHILLHTQSQLQSHTYVNTHTHMYIFTHTQNKPGYEARSNGRLALAPALRDGTRAKYLARTGTGVE